MKYLSIVSILSLAVTVSSGHAQEPVIDLEPLEVIGGPLAGPAADSPRWLGGQAAAAGRTTTVISPVDLRYAGAARLEDIVWQLPAASMPARFGAPGVPNLRGDAAELYFNGQRRADNVFGVPPSFATVGAVELLAGAPLLTSGPGKRSGGALNLLTLAADPQANATALQLDFGTWVPEGGSFLSVAGLIDSNHVLSDSHALRMVLHWRDDDTYYHDRGGRDNRRELFLSWQWQPQDATRLRVHLLYDDLDRPQVLGVNRPWQGLVDSGTYIAGAVTSGGFEPGLIGELPWELVDLPRDSVLLNPGDRGEATVWLGQVELEHAFGDEVKLHAAVLAESVDRSKEHAFAYAEEVSQLTVDALLRLDAALPHADVHWQTGLQLRYEDRANLTNYWNEFSWAYDLANEVDFDAAARFPEAIVAGFVEAADGRQWYLPSSPLGAPESSDSTLEQAGVFAVATWTPAPRWQVFGGLRHDWFDLQASEPRQLTAADRWSDGTSVNRSSFNAGVRYANRTTAVHLGYTKMAGVAGNTVGDGLNLYPPGELWEADFNNHSELWEAGVELRAGNGRSIGISAWKQNRNRREFFGSNDIRARGVTLQWRLRLRPQTELLGNAAFIDAHTDNAAPAEFGGGSLWHVYAPGEGPEGAGTGAGYLGGFLFNSLPAGDYRLPGLSRWTGSLALRQALGRGWSVQLWGTAQSAQRGNLAGEYEIPAQMEWNASLLYVRSGWEAQLTIRNLLDADNWRHNGDTFFNQMLISRDQPLRLQLRLRRWF